MKIINLILSVLFSLICFAQKTVKIQAKHQKKLIHTFKGNENLAIGETMMLFKSDGTSCEYYGKVGDDKIYNFYRDGKKLGSFTDFRFNTKGYQISINQDLKYTVLLNNKVIHGPYDFATLIYKDYQNNQVHGIQYREKNQHFYYDLQLKKRYGPYDNLSNIHYFNNNACFVFKKNNMNYIFSSEKELGPFKSVKYEYGSNNEQLIYYIQNSDDNWTILINNEILKDKNNKPYTFSKYPYLANQKLQIFNGKPTDFPGKMCYVTQDTFILQGNSQNYHFNGKNEFLKTTYNEKTKISTFYYKDKNIGEFISKDFYSDVSNSSYFSILLLKDDNVHVFNGNEIIKVCKKNEMKYNSIFVENDSICFLNSIDSSFYVNNTKIFNDKVSNAFYSNNKLIVIRKNGNYDEIYIDFKKVEDRKKIEKYLWNADHYKLASDPLTFIKKEDKLFVKINKTGKTFGPVNPSSKFLSTNDGKHLAENNPFKYEIYIDNKLISSGFDLNYNPKTNCFYWFELVNKSLYLHTYKNE